MTPAGQEHEPDAGRARRRHRTPRAGRKGFVVAEQGAVDVEGQEAEAAVHRPVHTSTRSITSPGRIFSTASMPDATWPKSV